MRIRDWSSVVWSSDFGAAMWKGAIAVGSQRHEPRAAVPMRGASRVAVGAERETAAEKAVDPLHPVNVGEQIGGGAGARAAGGAQEGRAAGRDAEIARGEGGEDRKSTRLNSSH